METDKSLFRQIRKFKKKAPMSNLTLVLLEAKLLFTKLLKFSKQKPKEYL